MDFCFIFTGMVKWLAKLPLICLIEEQLELVV